MRFTLILTLYLLVAFGASSENYGKIALRADRFYNQGEWASASAMFDLMLEEHPDSARTYGRAIVSAAMQADSAACIGLMDRSIEYHVPLDSVFEAVRTESFAIGSTSLYEEFLIDVKSHLPWLTRTIDAYLMDYYTFRHDGPMMVRYSSMMLRGMPDDQEFLKTLADGYLYMGDTEKGIETYKRLATVYPGNLDALLYLGNYYAMMSHDNHSNPEYPALAAKYLKMAYGIKPTPYLKAIVDNLK